ncbi:MAG: response regulator [Nitrospiraceae bacterium]|nr:MAG: response regulator [Nitrospiraceae bacterium]
MFSTLQNILLVNKDLNNFQSIEKALENCNGSLEIIRAQDADQGLRIVDRQLVDIIILDYQSSQDDRKLLDELNLRKTNIPVIALVEKGSELLAAEAIKEGACDYLIKDKTYLEALPQCINKALPVYSEKEVDAEDHIRQAMVFRQIFRSQKWWQNIIDAIRDYLFVIDSDYRILKTNKAFANLFGKEPADIIMQPYYTLYNLTSPHEWCPDSAEMNDRSPGAVEREINGKVFLISSFPISYDGQMAIVYIMKDITETRRLKDQVYHLDKLSSLGTLTSGVAHEINNPLTGIIGYTEMLMLDEKNEGSRKYLQKVYDSALRCKKIVENMLTFSRQKSAQKSPENINDVLDNTIELHEYVLKSTNIEIVREYDKVPYIDIDRQQMQQVLLNLLINAEHAISESDRKGRITFKTIHDREVNNIIITVSDNGSGISKEILPRIFDPFYTTKPVNKGTGLGLSIAHGIIAEQGGTIEVTSVIDKGSSFIIRLPV